VNFFFYQGVTISDNLHSTHPLVPFAGSANHVALREHVIDEDGDDDGDDDAVLAGLQFGDTVCMRPSSTDKEKL